MSLPRALDEPLRRLLRGASSLSAALLLLLAITAGLEPQPVGAGHAAPHFAPAAFTQAVIRAGDASPLASVQRAQHRLAPSFGDDPVALPPRAPRIPQDGVSLRVTAIALETLRASLPRAFNARAPPASAALAA